MRGRYAAMKYAWKAKTQIPIDPQVAGEHLEALSQQGALTPEVVVRDGEVNPRSPFRHFFEWNDALAAHEHRLSQARYLLRSIVVEIERPEQPEPSVVRAFLPVDPADEDRTYAPIVRIMSDADLRKQVLKRAKRELESWQDRYREYEELAKAMARVSEASQLVPV